MKEWKVHGDKTDGVRDSRKGMLKSTEALPMAFERQEVGFTEI